MKPFFCSKLFPFNKNQTFISTISSDNLPLVKNNKIRIFVNMKYLDPKSDLTFKRIFGEHPHLCKSLLNSLLPLEEDEQIVSLEYLPTEMVPEIPILKNTIVDVRCIDQKGRQFIVEMQMNWSEAFMNRVVFNASKAYVRQLDKTKQYKLLEPVYALNFVNYIFEPDIKDYYHYYKIVNTVHPDKTIEGLQFVFVELPKFNPKNHGEKKLQYLWLKFLTEIEESTEIVPTELLEESVIKDALEQLETHSYTKGQLDYYDRYWDAVRVEKTFIAEAKEALDKGRKEGIEKEKENSKNKVIDIAKNLLKNGVNVSIIAQTTGLSISEINALK